MDHGGETLVGFVVARGNAPEFFEFAEEVFDEMTPAIHGKVVRDVACSVSLGRNDGGRAACVEFGAQPIHVEGPVGQKRREIEILDEGCGSDAVVPLARQEHEAHQVAKCIHERHDLGGQPAT